MENQSQQKARNSFRERGGCPALEHRCESGEIRKAFVVERPSLEGAPSFASSARKSFTFLCLPVFAFLDLLFLLAFL
jgi:hypothetical protein